MTRGTLEEPYACRSKQDLVDPNCVAHHDDGAVVSVSSNVICGAFRQDFMFQVSAEEAGLLVTLCDTFPALLRRFRATFSPMLSSVLHSQRAIGVNIAIMRALVKLREIMATQRDLPLPTAPANSVRGNFHGQLCLAHRLSL
jgi:hypothetical protein